MTDEELLDVIKTRYRHGRIDTLTLTPDVRAQLAFDLSWLIGCCARLLHEQARSGPDAHDDEVARWRED